MYVLYTVYCRAGDGWEGQSGRRGMETGDWHGWDPVYCTCTRVGRVWQCNANQHGLWEIKAHGGEQGDVGGCRGENREGAKEK